MPLKPGSSKETVSETDIAYIAGIFDGEGCVNFQRVRRSFYIRVLIVNTDLDLLQYIQGLFGGDIKKILRRAGWKQSYCWRLSWSKAVGFLDQISPWLRVKRDQAIIAFCWDYHRLGRGKHSAEKKEDNRSVNEYLRECLTYLNKRGLHNLEDPILRELPHAL